MTSKQRSFLKGLAMKTEPIFQVGKGSITPEFTEAVREALEKRELVKLHVLKNNADDKQEIAQTLAERTGSIVVQVIGSMIVLFKYQKDAEKRKINL
ncbi:MAG: ribosome assembly RNA-binding protein YhbY [Lachnospiraceae bacterium]|nr:ribosome assembly RNA-binding protein YhbY [Lachnospiraceae bacterium]